MQPFHLLCFDSFEAAHLFDLLTTDLKTIQIKDMPGAYILGSANQTRFEYPWGHSPIFYIGQSNNLIQRMRTHQTYINQALQNYRSRRYKPKNQYGAAFGAIAALYKVKMPARSASDLEARLFELFYDAYGAIPVANGAWPRSLLTDDADA